MDNFEMLGICKKCGAKCCNLGGSDITEKERENILNAGYPDHTLMISENHYEFISKKGRCPYLKKDNSCGIQKAKPLACQCFPVHPEFVDGKKEYLLAQCPLGKALPREMILEMRDRATKYPDKIIKERLETSNLPKEDFELIKKRLNNFKSIKISE